MIWEVLLSNGEVVQEDPSDCSCWRFLRDRCHEEGLQIQEMKYDGKPIHPKADGFFVFFNAIGFMKSAESTVVTKAIGCTCQERKKVRVYWYDPGTSKKILTEAWPVKAFEMWNIAEEMLIPKYV